MKNKYRWLAGATILIVFALGVAVGIFGDLYLRDVLSSKPRPHRPPSPGMDSWAKELGLTTEQQTAIAEVFKETDQRWSLLDSEYNKQVGEIRNLIKQDIDRILTAEQRAKMEAMIRRFHEKARKASGKDRRDDKDFPREQDNRSQTRDKSISK
jgi:Spy/CpxP family protein refolding chaperone